MKKIFLLLAFTTLTTEIFYSCKKEISCEGCVANNQLPIAIAGSDQLITLPTDSTILDGSRSSDPDGKISQWLWTKISGPASFSIVTSVNEKTVVRNLIVGTYEFELKVTDNGGLSAKDTVMVKSGNASLSNHTPVANAGADQTITLPTSTVILDGSRSTDPDNNISLYEWTKVSGPSSFSIINASNSQTQVRNLMRGVYQFELKVSDAGGLFDKDTVQVTVIDPLPPCTDCKIVFVSDRDGNPEIYSCDADGSNIHRLTNDHGTDDEPTWSPDGAHIAFISDRTGKPELYIMNADGSNVVQKTFSQSLCQNPTWSPDGTRIAYATLSDGSLNIWVIGATSGAPSILFGAPGWDGQPAWSPDGAKIALVSDWAAYDFVYDIYIINADGTGFTASTGNIFDQLDYLQPKWSPDGMKLSMAISHRTGIDQYDTQVGIMNPDGSGLAAIKPGAAAWTKTSWSSDGTKILYTSQTGSRRDVSWVSADGSSSGTIVTNGWSADWQH